MQTVTYPNGGRTLSPDGEPRDFGDYELHEVLGSGGMGVVYRAFQRSLGIDVALKMIRAGRFASPEEVTRFREEARKVAQLHHPPIVRVLNCAEYDGRHYFTMELMQGGSLSRQIEHGPVPARRTGKWLLEISRAIQAVHEIDLVHRDLKPGNVVLDSQDTAYVTDFGLAKWLNQENSFTATGVIVGTLGYMSPEQAEGDSSGTGDIYGLGASFTPCSRVGRPFSRRPSWAHSTKFATRSQ